MFRLYPEKYAVVPGDKRRVDGFLFDEFLYENLVPLAETILDDMSYVLLVTGKGMVRVGKSVLAFQTASVLTEETNRIWKTDNKFDTSNVVFTGQDLIDVSFQKGKGAVIVLDEGDDLTEHYYSKLAMTLKRYFRKCGQLNQFLILIIPDFFDLPIPYAIGRSICLINVRLGGKLKRGYFDFYDFQKKKDLYILGKRMRNYDASDANFSGWFKDFYTINELEYRKKKFDDLNKEESNHEANNIRHSKYFNDDVIENVIYYLKGQGLGNEEIGKIFYKSEFNPAAFRAILSKFLNRNQHEDMLVGTPKQPQTVTNNDN